ncbi:protein of unknown function [Streptomyces murinus]
MTEPTRKYSISMPRDIAEAARARGGPSGLSAYVAAAVARQIERDNLNELIQVAEAEHGPVSEEEVQALRDQLHEARTRQTGDGAHAACPAPPPRRVAPSSSTARAWPRPFCAIARSPPGSLSPAPTTCA